MSPAGWAVKTTALLCYLLSLAGAGAFAALVLALGCDVSLPLPIVSIPFPLIVDSAWLAVFGLQHSGMARDAFKQRWVGLIAPSLERSVYAALSGLLLLGLALTWQPLPGPALWHGPLAMVALPLAAGACLAAINAWHDHAGLFGLRQAWGLPEPDDRLVVRGPYRLVRHPLMACLLVFLWAQPIMTPTLALLSGGLTVYLVVGLALEERDLLRRFRADYADYRRRVPALVPWRWPV